MRVERFIVIILSILSQTVYKFNAITILIPRFFKEFHKVILKCIWKCKYKNDTATLEENLVGSYKPAAVSYKPLVSYQTIQRQWSFLGVNPEGMETSVHVKTPTHVLIAASFITAESREQQDVLP